mgnify:CR=1 FL=1
MRINYVARIGKKLLTPKGLAFNSKNSMRTFLSKSFKMSYDGKDIPKSLDEFTIVKSENPISQGNTGTCWCFSTTSFYESEIFNEKKWAAARFRHEFFHSPPFNF